MEQEDTRRAQRKSKPDGIARDSLEHGEQELPTCQSVAKDNGIQL